MIYRFFANNEIDQQHFVASLVWCLLGSQILDIHFLTFKVFIQQVEQNSFDSLCWNIHTMKNILAFNVTHNRQNTDIYVGEKEKEGR